MAEILLVVDIAASIAAFGSRRFYVPCPGVSTVLRAAAPGLIFTLACAAVVAPMEKRDPWMVSSRACNWSSLDCRAARSCSMAIASLYRLIRDCEDIRNNLSCMCRLISSNILIVNTPMPARAGSSGMTLKTCKGFPDEEHDSFAKGVPARYRLRPLCTDNTSPALFQPLSP